MTNTPISLRNLRRNIYVHVCKMETLREVYTVARKNNGASGVDRVTFEVIEARGVEKFLKQMPERRPGGQGSIR
jgi:RNA-directed DNA polymerase